MLFCRGRQRNVQGFITHVHSFYAYNKDPGKRGHIVADTLLPMMFLGLRKLGNICCGHKMFLNKIRNTFCVPDAKFVSATNVARAGKRGNICVGNNVSATMCPRFPGLIFFVWRLSLLPAHGANPRKIPRWTVLVRENVSVNKLAY